VNLLAAPNRGESGRALGCSRAAGIANTDERWLSILIAHPAHSCCNASCRVATLSIHAVIAAP
jgi:hypothetical protein